MCGAWPNLEGDWVCIWKWKSPHRIQTFEWLVAHGCLLTNDWRRTWNSSILTTCSTCHLGDETQMCVLHDCVFTTHIWLQVLLSSNITNFFELDGKDQVFQNLNTPHLSLQGDDWQTTYMVTCWFLWQRRNKVIFEDGFQWPNDGPMTIHYPVNDIQHSRKQPTWIMRSDTMLVKWRPPENRLGEIVTEVVNVT